MSGTSVLTSASRSVHEFIAELVYRLLKIVPSSLDRSYLRLKSEGAENIPSEILHLTAWNIRGKLR